MNNGTIGFILAQVPIAWLLISLGKQKMSAYTSSLVSLLIATIIAAFYFRMPVIRVAEAYIEGAMLAMFPILWVILSALFVYNVTLGTGGMDRIRIMLSGISPDRRIQGLIIAFAFGGFLEGVAGFGTAVAIPASMLIAMGFKPVLAATVCLIANTVPVAFGVLGVPVITLSQVTSLPLDKLALNTSLQLVPFSVLLPVVLVYAITGKVREIKGVLGVSIVSGAVFSAGQAVTAVYAGPELAAVMGSLLSLGSIIVLIRVFPVKNPWRFHGEKQETQQRRRVYTDAYPGLVEDIRAWSPYIIIFVLVFTVKFLPFMDFLSRYPFVLKRQFYFGPGGSEMSFELVSGGTILFLSAILGGIIQGASAKSLFSVFFRTLKQLGKTIITVVSIVILAKVMVYSGMVGSIAETLAYVSGAFYPLIAPLLGAVGTFITGSDTSSNVLFGNLQKQAALSLEMSPEWLAAANAAGATAGKMISPQSISIAASAADLTKNDEGRILRTTIGYCLVYVILMGILIYVAGLHLF